MDKFIIIFMTVFLTACTSPVNHPHNVENGNVTYEYEELPEFYWEAVEDFCWRHTEAARVDPIYMVDICVYACQEDPSQTWCEALEEVIND